MGKPRAKVNRRAVSTDVHTCQQCGRRSLRKKLFTYPVPLAGKLAGRRIDVYRVEHNECRDCGWRMPTPEGQAKIERCTKTGIDFFLNHIP